MLVNCLYHHLEAVGHQHPKSVQDHLVVYLLEGLIIPAQEVDPDLIPQVYLLEGHVEVFISGVNINTLGYADDLDKRAETESSLRAQAVELESTSNSFSMRIKQKKTKVMCATKDPNPSPIHIVIMQGKDLFRTIDRPLHPTQVTVKRIIVDIV
ncbi:hypothetical protein QYM36_012647 [Artemia franciscana]|uniref:Reverse transcriptase domain-containing protein n=1 Tax=Artemia franciscana TaxID=6661 RepID=A0AA88L3D9_ARTSF|nr:hypothetical protein QYM36_012647 [Artemia franciscana]